MLVAKHTVRQLEPVIHDVADQLFLVDRDAELLLVVVSAHHGYAGQVWLAGSVDVDVDQVAKLDQLRDGGGLSDALEEGAA